MADEPTGKAVGGFARADALTAAERTAIATKAALARWADRLQVATHEGVLTIAGVELPVAVLEGGVRVLTSRALLDAFKRPWRGSYRRTQLPNFIDAKNLTPFITNELLDVLKPIDYRGTKGQRRGFRAEVLPLVCDVFLRAREDMARNEPDSVKLRSAQLQIAKQAEILVRSLSKVGIVALVDEVTGYQEIRPRDALQKYLEIVIGKELATWAKTFPDEFYENIYKLKGWYWPGMSKNRYSVVAWYTRDLIYERMAPPELLAELDARSPRNEKGQRPNKLFQWLSGDVGRPLLAQHMHSVVVLQRLAIANGYGWKRFVGMADQAIPKRDMSMFLPFIDPDDPIEP
jgi:hypothetical protein